jgi:hypothetical protein
MDIFYRFPTRIGHPILLMCASFVILLIFNLLSKFPAKNTNHSIFATAFVLGIFLFNVGMHHNLSSNLIFESSLNKLQSSYQGKILYIPPLVLKWEKMDPLKRYPFNFEMVFGGDTYTFSPHFYKRLEKLGVKKGYEMIPALMNNPNAFVVANDIFVKWLLYYLKKNHNIKGKAIAVERLANGSVVFKLKSIGRYRK